MFFANSIFILISLCTITQLGFVRTEDTMLNISSERKCPLPLTTLDFIHNFTETRLETVWPCEVRFHWLSIQPLVKCVRFLLAYVTPFVIVLGVLFNTISFGMLSMSVLSDSNLSLYLRSLVISDNGALIFNYAISSARSHFEGFNEIFMDSRFLCGMSLITMELFQFTSTWLVVSLTWARVFAIIFPFGIRGKYQSCSAAINIATLICTSTVISLTKLYYGGYESDSVFEFRSCQKKAKPWGIAMYFYIAFSTWLPLLFIFIGNILLIVHTSKSNRVHRQLTRNFTSSKTRIMRRTSRTLFAVSIVHLVLLLPLGIVETLELYWDVILTKHPASDAKNKEYIHWLQEKMLLKWCRGLFFHIYHWNFAINFFLYYLTGNRFRRIVIDAIQNSKKALYTKYCINCTSWSKYQIRTSSIQPSSVLLIKIITLSEQSLNSNITQSNSSISRSIR